MTETLGSVVPTMCGLLTLVMSRPWEESSPASRPIVGCFGAVGSPRFGVLRLMTRVAMFPCVPEASVAWMPRVLIPLLVNEAGLTWTEKLPVEVVSLAAIAVAGLAGL